MVCLTDIGLLLHCMSGVWARIIFFQQLYKVWLYVQPILLGGIYFLVEVSNLLLYNLYPQRCSIVYINLNWLFILVVYINLNWLFIFKLKHLHWNYYPCMTWYLENPTTTHSAMVDYSRSMLLFSYYYLHKNY